MEELEIRCAGLRSTYDIEHLARLFFPATAVRKSLSNKGSIVYARVGSRRMAVGLRTEERCVVRTALLPPLQPRGQEADKQVRLQISRLLYNLLCEETGIRPPWGMLTGVRPVALLRKLADEVSLQAASQALKKQYGISDEKLGLALDIYHRQQPFLETRRSNGYSLYISIPFCPSRCDYCSFVSRTIEREGDLVDPYLAKLDLELRETAQAAQRMGLQLETIYIGGGTPTSLNELQLERLLQSVARHFDTAAVPEYTVEAGRADCTNFEKLQTMRTYGATRVSVNPQTMNDDVLQKIDRLHSVQDTVACYRDARRAGFESINMDLIAGLPGDYKESFAETVESILDLQPDNITLHTLTLKRASNLVIEDRKDASNPSHMVAAAYPRFSEAGYVPYYLYRQKNGLHNLENTGWTKPGSEGLYNIYIMEEAQTILAVGAGGVSKLVSHAPKRIKRHYNPKFPLEYLKHFEEVLQQKQSMEPMNGTNEME